MRLMLDWLMVIHQMMEELRYVSMNCGVQYVMTGGISEMLQLSVDNWDIMDVRGVTIAWYNLYALSFQHPFL